jgi:hypothetical protein
MSQEQDINQIYGVEEVNLAYSKVELDVTSIEEGVLLAEKFDVSKWKISDDGPAGCPMMAFMGPHDRIHILLVEYHGKGPSDEQDPISSVPM